MRLKRACLVAGLALAASGCEIVQAEIQKALGVDYDIPLTGETPEIEVDVGKAVAKLEDSIFEKRNDSDSTRQNYEILVALCETDPSMGCEPQARFPQLIPRYLWPYGCIIRDGANVEVHTDPAECTMDLACEETDLTALSNGIDLQNPPAGNGCVDVSHWLEQVEGLEDVTQIAQAVQADLSEHGSINDVRQIKKITVKSVIFKFKDNTFTYPIPQIDGFVGEPVGDEAVKDARALIDNNTISLFGTLTTTPPAFKGDKAMQLDGVGRAKLSEALKSLRATVAAQANMEIPPETTPEDADNCRHPDHLPSGAAPCEGFPKPDGVVKITVELSLIVTINPSGN